MSGPWMTELPKIALSCDYLTHGMMSTAALHLAYLRPGQLERYQLLSVQHQDVALGPFQIAMSNITTENCNQVFGFSLLLMVSHFASFRALEFFFPSPVAGNNGLSDWVIWHRGCQTILNQARESITSGPLAPLIGEEQRARIYTEAAKQLSGDENDKSLENVLRCLDESPSIKASTTVAELEAYKDATTRLRRLLKASSQTEDSVIRRAFASIWPVVISDTFIQLLSQLQPLALVIMAHYCLLIKNCHSCWYMEHRAYHMFDAVKRNLSEEWTIYIEHPLRVLGAGPGEDDAHLAI